MSQTPADNQAATYAPATSTYKTRDVYRHRRKNNPTCWREKYST
jgi:hypothetical protein